MWRDSSLAWLMMSRISADDAVASTVGRSVGRSVVHGRTCKYDLHRRACACRNLGLSGSGSGSCRGRLGIVSWGARLCSALEQLEQPRPRRALCRGRQKKEKRNIVRSGQLGPVGSDPPIQRFVYRTNVPPKTCSHARKRLPNMIVGSYARGNSQPGVIKLLGLGTCLSACKLQPPEVAASGCKWLQQGTMDSGGGGGWCVCGAVNTYHQDWLTDWLHSLPTGQNWGQKMRGL